MHRGPLVRVVLSASIAIAMCAPALTTQQVFTGGIGENSAEIRTRICRGLEWLGLELDPARNAECVDGAQGVVSTEGSRLAAWVIPTDEELLIAHDTVRVITTGDPHAR